MLHRSIYFDVFSLRRKPRVDYVSFLVQRNEALLTVGFRWWLFCNLRFDLPLKDRIALKRGFSEWYLRNLDNKRIKKVLINTEKWGLNTFIVWIYFRKLHVIRVYQIIVKQKAQQRRRLQWLKIPVFIRLGSTSLNSFVSRVWSPKNV